jgi:hypothetical protein
MRVKKQSMRQVKDAALIGDAVELTTPHRQPKIPKLSTKLASGTYFRGALIHRRTGV